MLTARPSAPDQSGPLDFPKDKFFTNKKAPYGHNSTIAKALDGLGKVLSLRREGPWTWNVENVINKVLVYGSIGTLGLLGGALRATASISKNMKIVTNPTPTDTLSSSTSIIEVATDDKAFSLGVYTLNTGIMSRLPYAKKSFINAKILGENRQRAADIADDIRTLKPDIVHLQEVFDEAAEAVFHERLKDIYPHEVGAMGNELFTVGSGLMFFSKYPVIEYQFLRHDHSMFGEETLATKGAFLAVLEIAGKKVLTISTHTQSGGAACKGASVRWGGTTGDRRDRQLGDLDAAISRMEKKHQVDLVVFSGDINHRVENLAKQHSVSQGGREKQKRTKSVFLPHIPAPALGSIKYPHINQLMNRFNVIDPNLKSKPEAKYISELDRTLDSTLEGEQKEGPSEFKEKKGVSDDTDTSTYAELKYTRGPFNYKEVKIGGKTNTTHDWKKFQKEIYEGQSIYQGEKIPTYTGTAVVNDCLQSGPKDELADQGKLIDVTLVSSTQELPAKMPNPDQFTLFKPSVRYQQQSIIHSVRGRSDHHALFTKVTEYHSTLGTQALLAIAKTEPPPIVLDPTTQQRLRTENSRPRSYLQKLGYR